MRANDWRVTGSHWRCRIKLHFPGSVDTKKSDAKKKFQGFKISPSVFRAIAPSGNQIDVVGSASRHSSRNSLCAAYAHGEVRAFPSFRLMPVERETNVRTSREMLCRQIEEMDSKTDLSRVVIMA